MSSLVPSAPTTSEIHHALLRPVILQILRAQGYYSSTSHVVDALTELTGTYLSLISHQTAEHAARSNPLSLAPNVSDVRMALEDCGALWPQRDVPPPGRGGGRIGCADDEDEDQEEPEDTRGVDDFISWAKGKKNLRIRKVAGVHNAQASVAVEGEEVEERPTDYLSAIKKRHNKTDEDSKYVGTLLGKGIDHGEVSIDGGNFNSLQDWAKMMREQTTRPQEPDKNDDDDDDDENRPPSSGLSSIGSGDIEMTDMDVLGGSGGNSNNNNNGGG